MFVLGVTMAYLKKYACSLSTIGMVLWKMFSVDVDGVCRFDFLKIDPVEKIRIYHNLTYENKTSYNKYEHKLLPKEWATTKQNG